MSTNQYNENIDPKKAAAEEAAAADALKALGGSTVEKKVRKKTVKEPTIEIVGEDGSGTGNKNKYVTEEEKSATDKKTKKSAQDTPSGAGGSGEKKERVSTRRTIVQIMNGEILTKDTVLNNLPFTFFIGFLFIVMIAWGYYAETVTKKEIQLEKDLGELNSEFFTLTADYNMQRGRRQIANRLEQTGVKESQTSPKKIRVRKYVFN